MWKTGEIDVYMGLNIGGFYRASSDNHSSTGMGIGAQVGGRYYFSDNFGVNLELGGGTVFDWGKLGLTFTF